MVQRGAHNHHSLISRLNASLRINRRLSAACHKFVHFPQDAGSWKLLRSSTILFKADAWHRAFLRIFNYTF